MTLLMACTLAACTLAACTTVQSPERDDVLLFRAKLASIETGDTLLGRVENGETVPRGWRDILHFTVTNVLIGHTDEREIAFPVIETVSRLTGFDYYLLATRTGETLKLQWLYPGGAGLCIDSDTIRKFSISQEVAELRKTDPCR